MSIIQKDTTDINQVKEIKRELKEADRIEDIVMFSRLLPVDGDKRMTALLAVV